jgi:argininosuccinate lyase
MPLRPNESRKIRKNPGFSMSSCRHLGKFSMDVCLYMSQNFDFITLPAHLTTGSSIMPHKKPDVFDSWKMQQDSSFAIRNHFNNQ